MLSEGDEVLRRTACLTGQERFAGPVFRTGAGAFYAIIVFLIGFILGTIRVLLLAPRQGETSAVITAAPGSRCENT